MLVGNFKQVRLTDEFVRHEVIWNAGTATGTEVKLIIRTSAPDPDLGQRMDFLFWFDRLVETKEAFSTASDIFKFNLQGTLTNQEQSNILNALVQRYSPAHCHPDYDITFNNNVYGAAVCGTGFCSGTSSSFGPISTLPTACWYVVLP